MARPQGVGTVASVHSVILAVHMKTYTHTKMGRKWLVVCVYMCLQWIAHYELSMVAKSKHRHTDKYYTHTNSRGGICNALVVWPG